MLENNRPNKRLKDGVVLAARSNKGIVFKVLEACWIKRNMTGWWLAVLTDLYSVQPYLG